MGLISEKEEATYFIGLISEKENIIGWIWSNGSDINLFN